jgi:glycosyltransferase involved in cell wall biosynthesis
MIRVLHVTEDHSTTNTGISSAVDALTRCVPAEIRPAILCVGEETLPVRPGLELTAFPTRGLAKTWRYSAGSYAALARAVAESDVIHLHGLWMWVQWAAAREAVRQKKPFVLSAHGMLEPWIWQRQSALNRLKKYLYWNGIAYPAFRRVDLLHALTAQEARTLSGYFPDPTTSQKTLLIPHGIDIGSADAALAGLPSRPAGEPPYFLFLGRLHPVKAIHLLIRAFARLPANPFVLKLAGPTQPQETAYAESLRRLAGELNLGERVVFTGAVRGSAKWQLYRDAWAFCLPSFSEVIGLVNLEAAAARTPVITSYESGVVEEWEQEGGLRVHPHEESILGGLQKALAWSASEREQRGQALRSLVERQYRWERVGKEWAEGYQRLIGAGNHA